MNPVCLWKKLSELHRGSLVSLVPSLPNELVPLDESLEETVTYIVVMGDYLWKIADDLYDDGERWVEIYDMNKDAIGKDPNFLRIGQVLIVASR